MRTFPVATALVATLVIALVIVTVPVTLSPASLRELLWLRTLPTIRLLHAMLSLLLHAVQVLLIVPTLMASALALILF